MNIKAESNNQSGGKTIGVENLSISKYIWKGRKEGFFATLIIAVIVEIILKFIFK